MACRHQANLFLQTLILRKHHDINKAKHTHTHTHTHTKKNYQGNVCGSLKLLRLQLFEQYEGLLALLMGEDVSKFHGLYELILAKYTNFSSRMEPMLVRTSRCLHGCTGMSTEATRSSRCLQGRNTAATRSRRCQQGRARIDFHP